MSFYKKNIGQLGEGLAYDFLKLHKYQILFRNFNTKLGEIDIIAEKSNKIIFVEVKTRVGLSHGYPHEAVDLRKIKHLHLAAQLFLLQNNFKNYKLSLGVISVLLNEDMTVNKIKFFDNVEL